MLDKTLLGLERLVEDEYRAEVVKNGGTFASHYEGYASILATLEEAYDSYWFVKRQLENEWRGVKAEDTPDAENLTMMRKNALRAAGEYLTFAAKIDKYIHSVEVWERNAADDEV